VYIDISLLSSWRERRRRESEEGGEEGGGETLNTEVEGKERISGYDITTRRFLFRLSVPSVYNTLPVNESECLFIDLFEYTKMNLLKALTWEWQAGGRQFGNSDHHILFAKSGKMDLCTQYNTPYKHEHGIIQIIHYI